VQIDYSLTDKGLPSEKWIKDGFDQYIEFITHDHAKNNYEISGITAQGLTYFSMSLDNTVKIDLPSGKFIKVVSPVAFVAHKLLTYTRRLTNQKMIKDLYYVCYVANNVYDSRDDLVNELNTLDMHDKWRKTMKKISN